MSGIFISYRVADSGDIAGRLYDHLSAAFGQQHIFKDSYHLKIGIDFRDQLKEALAKCSVLIVLIGEKWVNITDDKGKRRLDNPADWVRIEVATGLKRGIPVIPVLLKGAAHPTEAELPKLLHALAHRQSIVIRDDPFFPGDVAQLINTLKNNVPFLAASPGASQVPLATPAQTFTMTMTTNGGNAMQNVNIGGTQTNYLNVGAARIQALTLKIEMLQADSQTIQMHIRHKQDILNSKQRTQQTRQYQHRGKKSLLLLVIALLTISIGVGFWVVQQPIATIASGIIGSGLLLGLLLRPAQIETAPIVDLELDLLRGQRDLIKEVIARYQYEIEQLGQISS